MIWEAPKLQYTDMFFIEVISALIFSPRFWFCVINYTFQLFLSALDPVCVHLWASHLLCFMTIERLSYASVQSPFRVSFSKVTFYIILGSHDITVFYNYLRTFCSTECFYLFDIWAVQRHRRERFASQWFSSSLQHKVSGYWIKKQHSGFGSRWLSYTSIKPTSVLAK